jgi:hypothetical protein
MSPIGAKWSMRYNAKKTMISCTGKLAHCLQWLGALQTDRLSTLRCAEQRQYDLQTFVIFAMVTVSSFLMTVR